MTIAEEIRKATSENRLHPLVRDNWASPRGLCNASLDACETLDGILFCALEYGHTGPHINGPVSWELPWVAPTAVEP
jgi:hypothetical protein